MRLVVFILLAVSATDFTMSQFAVRQGREYNTSLDGEGFDQYAKKLVGDKKVVKLIYFRELGKVYFFDTKKNPYHFKFAQKHLGIPEDLTEFNTHYIKPGEMRKYNMASLVEEKDNSYLPENSLLLELWSGDTLRPPYLEEFYFKVQGALTGIDLIYHPLSFLQEESVSNKDLGMSVVTTEEMYQNRKYWALNPAEAIGKLVFVRGDECLDYNNIAVFDNVPNDIGLLGGVVTSEYQTPLSHINVKCMNRKTANMVLKNAFEELSSFENEVVHLKVHEKKFEIKKISAEDGDRQIQEFWQKKRPLPLEIPQSVLPSPYRGKFLSFEQISPYLLNPRNHKYGISLIGAKATNVALLSSALPKELRRRFGFSVPKGFGVPFDFYEEFMNTEQEGSTPYKLIRKLLEENNMDDARKMSSVCEGKKVLEKVRSIILGGRVPESLLENFYQILYGDESSPLHVSKVPRIRLRSSTNAEDLEGFNGAGLYNSAGISLYKNKNAWTEKKSWQKVRKKLEKKICEVYAGIWNDRAFYERNWYSIDHFKVKLAMAVHRSYPRVGFNGAPGELANGVALTMDTSNPSQKDRIYLNGQHYDLAVTNPPLSEDLKALGENPDSPYKTEECIVDVMEPNGLPITQDFVNYSYIYKGRSSVNEGAKVLRDDPQEKRRLQLMEIRRLSMGIKEMTNALKRVYENEDLVTDVEWKVFGPKRKLLIKQVRPFNK